MKRRILSMLCVLALMLSMLAMPAYATDQAPGTVAAVCGEKNYSSLQAAMDDYSFGTIVLQNDAQDVTVPLNVHLDTNGHNVAGVTVADSATLYVSDSQTDDYTVADGIYGKITDATGAVQADEGYVAVTEEGAVSYHKADLTLTSMTLRPAVAGVYYNSAFAADEVLAANVECYGVALSVVAEPTAENLDTLCGYSTIYGFANGEKSGTLLTGIMTEGNTDFANDRNAAMDIYGRAYIKTAEGYTFGATASRSLKEQVQAIDAVFATLNAAQKTSILEMYKDHESVMSAWELANITEVAVGVLAGDVEITVPVETQDGEVIETVTVEQDGVTVTIPFGTLVDTNELTLTVTKETETDVEAAEGQSLLPLDVHVEGLSAANTVPLTIELGKVMPENLNMGNYAAYHTEDNGANEMTLVANDEEFTAHNQYKYTLDGEVTLHVASFSLFTLRSTDSNAWAGERTYDWYDPNATELYIRNADQLAGFGAIVGNMASVDGETIAQDSFNGKTVKLLADIYIGDLDSENAYVFYPIGYWNNRGSYEKCYGEADVSSGFYAFQGIFDGNGNTISDFYQNTWEMVGDYNDGYSGTPNYYRDGMGLFGKVYGGTVKNLTVRNFSCDSEHGTSGTIAAYADCGATFENISIFGCNPRVYNIGNGGIVGCSGWYAQEAAADKVTFKNITVDQTNKISALWDATGTSAGGILGQYYPTSGQSSAGYPENPGILFENCHTAAIIEVNNDCCSNYHYYWYRYSGMLMGSIRKNTTEGGYTVADTTGITAEGCTYTYGNWNEYWYCELVKNTIASYTHDHQFSRLTSITDLSEITDDGGKTWLKEGNFALLDENRNCEDCYHIFKDSNGTLYRHLHDQADESNGYEPYENFDVNNDGVTDAYDLKEDRQRYYIPFSQLFTGDGMGVKAHHEFSGVTVSKDGVALADEKFQVKEGADLVFDPDQTVKLSDIVELTDFGKSKLTSAALNATASPVTEEDTVNVTYHQDVKDWTNNTITFSEDSYGHVKLVLTDYFYCKPTVIYATVGDVMFDSVLDVTLAQNKEKLVIAENTTLTANQIFSATLDDIEGTQVQISLEPADENSTVEPVTFTSTGTEWASGTVQFKGRGQAIVTATSGESRFPITVTVGSVNEAAKAMVFPKTDVVEAVCPACAVAGDTSIKTWNPLAEQTTGKIMNLDSGHYYLSESSDYTSNNYHYTIGGPSLIRQVCINLNEKDITSSARVFYNENKASLLNIMGKGTVSGRGIAITDGYRAVLDLTSDTNLYGGTYISTREGAPAVENRASSHDTAVLAIYDDAVIRNDAGGIAAQVKSLGNLDIQGGTIGKVYNSGTTGTVTVSGAPVIENLDLSNGKLVAVGELVEGADITVTADGQFTNEIATGAELCKGYFHPIEEGSGIAVKDNALYIADICEHCSMPVLDWQALTLVGGEKLTESGHYYLTEETNLTKQVLMQTADTDIVIDMRGHNVISGTRAFYVGNDSEAIGGIKFSLMDTVGTSVVTANANSGGGVLYVITYGSAPVNTINVYGGIYKNTNPTTTLSGGCLYASQSVMNIYRGTFYGHTVAADRFGGTLYNYGSTVSIYGGTFYTGDAAGLGDCFYVVDRSSHNAILNIQGDVTVNGQVLIKKNAEVNISGKATVDYIEFESGATANISDLDEASQIKVVATDGVAFTNDLGENATNYKNCFSMKEETDRKALIVSADNKLMIDDLCPHCDEPLSKISEWISIEHDNKTYEITKEGHYKLAATIDATSAYNVIKTSSENVVIDTCGYNINTMQRAFYVPTGELTVFDSVGGSTINSAWSSTGGGADIYALENTKVSVYDITMNGSDNVSGRGSCILALAGSTLNIYSGEINGAVNGKQSTANRATICSEGTVNIEGGQIEPATLSDNSRVSVYVYNNNKTTASLRIAGGQIDGLVRTGKADVPFALGGAPKLNNLMLCSEQKLTLEELTDGADITVNASGVFTNEGVAEYQEYFHHADVENYHITADENGALVAAERDMQVGFGRVSILPTKNGVQIAGGDASARLSNGNLDETAATCIAIQEGNETILLYTIDLITVDEHVYAAQTAIAEATGIPAENIILNCTHTHSGVSIRTDWETEDGYTSDDYRAEFNQACADAAVAALEDLSPAAMYYGSTMTEGMVFVRHYLLENGETYGNGHGSLTGTAIKDHLYDSDGELQVIRFARPAADKKDVVLMNLGAHGTIMNAVDKYKISADWVYNVRTYVEHEVVEGIPNMENESDFLCAVFEAAAGDQIPNSKITERAQYGNKYPEFGYKIGEYCMGVLNGEMTNAEGYGITLKKQTYTAATMKEGAEDETRVKQALEIAALVNTYGSSSDEVKAMVKEYGFYNVYEATGLAARSKRPDTYSMELHVMSIDGVSFIFAPFEMFGVTGREIKDSSPYDMTFVVTCSENADGYHRGYIPTEYACEQSFYEYDVTKFARGTAEDLVTTYVTLLNELKEN